MESINQNYVHSAVFIFIIASVFGHIKNEVSLDKGYVMLLWLTGKGVLIFLVIFNLISLCLMFHLQVTVSAILLTLTTADFLSGVYMCSLQ